AMPPWGLSESKEPSGPISRAPRMPFKRAIALSIDKSASLRSFHISLACFHWNYRRFYGRVQITTDNILLTINVAHEPNGTYYSQIEEGVSGSSSDTGGNTLQEVVISALEWAGVTELDLPDNPSMD